MIQLNPHEMKLFVDSLEVSIDTHGKNSFISHAHLDHSFKPRKSEKILASEATLDLMEARGLKIEACERTSLKEAGVKMELLNSGHVLGGSQLFVEDSNSFVYTSDFKLSDSLTVKGAPIKECDILMIESTYGSPEYVFPSREQVQKDIGEWVRKESEKGNSVVLGGYTLGKAQELIRILNEELGVAPLVNESISRLCGVYAKHGIKMNYINSSSDEGKALLEKSFVSVLPLNFVRFDLLKGLENAYGRRVSGGIASGWSLSRNFFVHKAFCLSDHADFPQLMEYVESSGAKKVVCVHGFSQRFASELRNKGIEAIAVDEMIKGQKTLFGYY